MIDVYGQEGNTPLHWAETVGLEQWRAPDAIVARNREARGAETMPATPSTHGFSLAAALRQSLLWRFTYWRS